MKLSLASKFIKFALPTISLLALGYTAKASDTMNFDTLKNDENINGYYDGGNGSKGSGPGPNYGVIFSSNAEVLTSGSFSNNPSGKGIMFFLNGAPDMNVAGGFNTALSFYYASTQAVTVDIYSGLNGTGTLLATKSLAATPNPYNVWDNVSVSFAGTAESAVFVGAPNFCGFDNITITPNTSPVPEAGTMFGLTALFAMGGVKLMRDRRKKNANA